MYNTIIRVCLIILFYLMYASSFAVYAQVFPKIKGEMINDNPVSIPTYILGKRAIVGITFSTKAEDAMKNDLNHCTIPLWHKASEG
jgi:hypothetical protein